GSAGGQGPAVAFGQDADTLDIAPGFGVGRDAAVAVDHPFAGVVAGGGEAQIAVVALEQPGQVLDAAADVLAGVENILDAETVGRGRDQLHQALGAGVGDGIGPV